MPAGASFAKCSPRGLREQENHPKWEFPSPSPALQTIIHDTVSEQQCVAPDLVLGGRYSQDA